MTLELVDVSMDYGLRGREKRALDGVNITVSPREFLCVVGASGSGKSTLLSLVAGLTTPTSGVITIDGRPITGPGPDRGLVFQTGSLYPWRTVERNVAFGLELLDLDAAERRRRVDWYLAETGLADVRRSLPRQLSGGQQQRAAIARALVCEPDVLLLDEPFGALDVQTKEDMQLLIRQIWRDTGTTVLMVTHDVEEAVFLGTRVVVLASDPGRVAADLRIPLAEDRTLATKRSPAFLELRASVEDLVRAQHRSGVAR
ncbi:ABC transporter ATP-binding protein [Lentzea flava]|uniref:ABC transporter ATP-binding protein n=1 Tax=Lentzea flava TaxID=103732 RepID=A0ABQ2UAF5_9PSEU|nr:ABC transporter ATP-binding protein [Lentzea flava]MCP2196639.1 NitT/TauT family transport system ATP-binding protein [Lentzea flava]GGU16572.1 ABC transporter ATP-binding protein [Lentzea flava]